MNASKFSLSAFVASLPSDVSVAQSKAAKFGGVQAAAAAYLKGGQKEAASIGAMGHVWKGIVQAAAYGNRTILAGFAVASKKQSHVFRSLVEAGIVSDSGAVTVPLCDDVAALVRDSDARAALENALPFVAWCMAQETTGKAAADTAKAEAAKAEAAKAAQAEAAAAAAVGLTVAEAQAQAAAKAEAEAAAARLGAAFAVILEAADKAAAKAAAAQAEAAAAQAAAASARIDFVRSWLEKTPAAVGVFAEAGAQAAQAQAEAAAQAAALAEAQAAAKAEAQAQAAAASDAENDAVNAAMKAAAQAEAAALAEAAQAEAAALV